MDQRAESRQLRGKACGECRKENLRCDKQRPKCSACINAQTQCEYTERRAPRGSRKARRGRIAAHEPRFSSSKTEDVSTTDPEASSSQTEVFSTIETEASCSQMGDMFTADTEAHEFDLAGSANIHDQAQDSSPSLPDWSLIEENNFSPTPIHLDRRSSDIGSQVSDIGTQVVPFSNSSTPSPFNQQSPSFECPISELMKADLIQIYVDRVHSTIPMLNLSKLFNSISGTDEQRITYPEYLLYSVYVAATAFSSQFTEFSDVQVILYDRAMSLLRVVDTNNIGHGEYHIEQIQSWILITFYEFATDYRQAKISADHVFQLVKYSGLNDLDSPKPDGSHNEALMLLEEKRRTFWVAYYMEQLLNVVDGTPTTFNEDSIATRLPYPGSDIVNHVSKEAFLLEAMSCANSETHSQLGELVILTTICTRAVAHKHWISMGPINVFTHLDIVATNDWLDGVLSQRLARLRDHYPCQSPFLDPVVAFSYMIAYSAMICLCESMETVSAYEQHRVLLRKAQDRGIWAAVEITRLASHHQFAGYFNCHTFVPLAIYIAACRLASHLVIRGSELDPAGVAAIEETRGACIGALGKLKAVNNLAAHYFQLLEST